MLSTEDVRRRQVVPEVAGPSGTSDRRREYGGHRSSRGCRAVLPAIELRDAGCRVRSVRTGLDVLLHLAVEQSVVARALSNEGRGRAVSDPFAISCWLTRRGCWLGVAGRCG
jgi:hypothetical protein